jgi:hypothetical protein
MADDIAYRVWKLRFSDQAPTEPSFCVNAASPEAAASQIALELSMGGYYRVHEANSPLQAFVVRIVPVTTYEAVETIASTSPGTAQGVGDQSK